MGGEEEEKGSGGEREIGGVGFVVAAEEPVGEGACGPSAMAVRKSGLRKADMARALRSRKWPKESA